MDKEGRKGAREGLSFKHSAGAPMGRNKMLYRGGVASEDKMGEFVCVWLMLSMMIMLAEASRG